MEHIRPVNVYLTRGQIRALSNRQGQRMLASDEVLDDVVILDVTDHGHIFVSTPQEMAEDRGRWLDAGGQLIKADFNPKQTLTVDQRSTLEDALDRRR